MRHPTRSCCAATLVAFGVLAAGPNVRAEERKPSYLEQRVPAASDAFELRIGSGYTQGFGNVAPNRGIPSVAGAGVGFGVDLDYRIDALASVGLEAQYQEFKAENNSAARGLALNLGATFHFLPQQRGDPWLRVGAGYRLLWDLDHVGTPDNINTYHGPDIVTVKVGYDFRPSSDVAFAPVVGADLQTFVFDQSTPLTSVQVGTFVYAGVQGRFDTVPESERKVARAR